MATYSFDDIALDDNDMGVVWIEGLGFRPREITEEFCGQIVGETQCTSGVCSGKYALEIIPDIYEPQIIDPVPYASAYIPEIYATPYKTPWVPTDWPDPWIPWISTGCCTIVTPDPEYPNTLPPVDAPFSLVLMLSAIAAIGVAKWK
ncbi:hypothetical protein PP753_gp72 [Dinoroseobacter phage vB_DshP-R7L]|uniref:Uncharacterized protein n=1 Tax=Dinoroseobacter phage vB_DshP-R7L TaxID=2873349 RepID=A0AAE8XC22_9CAUD|nr:hypothetical protein PP753_gp72 [Dinoroseobacter phage vB_DshP-R7L]UAT28886.1 hypothetical protein R7L_gp47 [Dinoroseobacter phage vB_DshP-R7L]